MAAATAVLISLHERIIFWVMLAMSMSHSSSFATVENALAFCNIFATFYNIFRCHRQQELCNLPQEFLLQLKTWIYGEILSRLGMHCEKSLNVIYEIDIWFSEFTFSVNIKPFILLVWIIQHLRMFYKMISFNLCFLVKNNWMIKFSRTKLLM